MENLLYMLLRQRFCVHCLAFVLLISPIAFGVELTESEKQFIEDHPRIIVGGENDWPPMDFVEDGVYKGAAKDYLDEVSAISGLQFDVVTGYNWAELLRLLHAREVDVLPMMYWTERRGRELNLTSPFMTVRQYAFTYGSQPNINRFEDLAGMLVAIPSEYGHIDYLEQNHPRIQILEVNSPLDAIDAVVTGRADALIENTAVIDFYSKKQNIIGLVPAFSADFEIDNVHMAIRKDWAILRDILEKSLHEIPPSRHAEIMATWTGSTATAKAFQTPTANLNSAEKSFLQSQAQITACINANRMPFELMRGFNHEGMTSDYLSIVSEQLSIPILTKSSQSWQEAKGHLAAGRCDLVSIAVNRDRPSDGLIYTGPYLDQNLALATKIDSGFFQSLDDISSVAIGVIDGYTDIDGLRKAYPDVEFVIFESIDDGMSAVSEGEIFGLLDYVSTISNVISREYVGSLKISSGFPDDLDGFRIAVRAELPLLATAIDKALQSIPLSVHQNIHRKWVAVSIEKETDYTLTLQIAVVVAAVFIFLLFRFAEVRSHREEIQAKNSALKSINAKLEEQSSNALHMAYHDQLTGLPNRTKLLEDLGHAMRLCRRTGGKLAVLFLDLDRFKIVNDTLGHDIGDKLLQAVAKRIRYALRDTDILCRIGGDEFVVVLDAISDEYSPSVVSKRIVEVLEQSFTIGEHTVTIGTSIGISVCPDDTDELHSLMKFADSAMYSAKDNGRNGFRYYHEELSIKVARRLEIETALRRSLKDQSFSLAIQPIVDLEKREVVKAEALIRWNHAELGVVPPDEFIPIAEEFGLIVEIGEWVLGEACKIVRSWNNESNHIAAIAINVSSVEFLNGNIASRFRKIIESHNVRPQQIELEITEHYMLDHSEDVEAELYELQRQGHSIGVDDFGTGYSSLSYMQRLPLRTIKIDRSFIQNVPHDSNDVAISQAIISLSHDLGYEVVAEGVETEAQLDFLLDRGCNFAQGYFFGKPVSAAEFPKLVEKINHRLRIHAGWPARLRSIR